MDNLLVDQRDQEFVLHEMLCIEELFKTPFFSHFMKESYWVHATLSRIFFPKPMH